MLRMVHTVNTQNPSRMSINIKVSRNHVFLVCAPDSCVEEGWPWARIESKYTPSPCTSCWANSYNLIMTFNVWNGAFYIFLKHRSRLLCIVLPVYIAMQIIPGGEFTNCTSIINRVMIFPIPLLSLLLAWCIIHTYYPLLVSVPGHSSLPLSLSLSSWWQ